MNREEKKAMGLIISAHVLVHLYEGVLPPLIPLLILDFHTDYFHLGMIATIFSYAFGLGALPAGFLSDRLGPLRLVSIYLFGAGLFSVFIWPVNSLVIYGVLMAFVGIFSSTYHPAANTLIAHSIREKGKAFGMHGIAGSLGVAAVPGLSAWIGSAMGWEVPHVTFGFLGLFIGLYSLSFRGPSSKTGSAPLPRGQCPHTSRASYLSVVVLFLCATTLGLTYKGIMTFLPVYMGQNVQLSFLKLDRVTLGGTVATIALLSGAVGQYVSGRLIDRYNPERILLGSIAIGTIFVFLMAKFTNIILICSAVAYAFFYFSAQPTQNYLVAKYLPRHRQGLGYGIIFFLSFGVGATSAAVCGYLADHFGLEAVFYAMAVCFIGSSFFAWLLVVMTSRQRENGA